MIKSPLELRLRFPRSGTAIKSVEKNLQPTNAVPTVVRTRYHHGTDIALDGAFFKDDFSRMFDAATLITPYRKETRDEALLWLEGMCFVLGNPRLGSVKGRVLLHHGGVRYAPVPIQADATAALSTAAPRSTSFRRQQRSGRHRRRPRTSVAAHFLRFARSMQRRAPITERQMASAMLEVMCLQETGDSQLRELAVFFSASSIERPSAPNSRPPHVLDEIRCTDAPPATTTTATPSTPTTTTASSPSLPPTTLTSKSATTPPTTAEMFALFALVNDVLGRVQRTSRRKRCRRTPHFWWRVRRFHDDGEVADDDGGEGDDVPTEAPTRRVPSRSSSAPSGTHQRPWDRSLPAGEPHRKRNRWPWWWPWWRRWLLWRLRLWWWWRWPWWWRPIRLDKVQKL